MEHSDTRLKRQLQLNSATTYDGECVLYVMSRDQRVADNEALYAAQQHALHLKLPLEVLFVIYDKPGVRAREHVQFMLAGLQEVDATLSKVGIGFRLVTGNALECLQGASELLKPAAVFFDFSPLNGPRQLQKRFAAAASMPVFVVDAHNLIPVWVTSPKQEVAAYTIRPKIHKLIAQYLDEPPCMAPHPYREQAVKLPQEQSFDQAYQRITALPSNGADHGFIAGETAARKQLTAFLEQRLVRYATDRNDPTLGAQSDLSPYLHFGMLSSARIVFELRVKLQESGMDLSVLLNDRLPRATDEKPALLAGADVLFEEMVVRKELSDNFCFYNAAYLSLDGAPQWALTSLNKHRDDPRDFIYTLAQFEDAQTHDPAWNAAQNQLHRTGKMHGYMRMYWAKKVLEWSPSPDEALRTLIFLNDHYSIDGGDPNGYVGILWSVAGLHDRPWFERPVYGVIRYMNAAGLARKYKIQNYIDKYARIV